MDKLLIRTVLPRAFYQREAPVVAQELLGKYLVRKIDNQLLIGKIVETETYLGENDPAAHSFIGKTKRNEVLFGEAGIAYVHSIHRYHCFDIVTETTDKPSSVLISAIEPVERIDIMQQFRNSESVKGLTNGPGKVCQAFQITRELNGVDVTNFDSVLFVTEGETVNKDLIAKSGRIGISKAKDLLLRYCIKTV